MAPRIWTLLILACWTRSAQGQAGVPPPGSDYNDVNRDGSYRFGFQTGDAGAHYQAAVANQKNQVAGRFGSWDPAQRRVVDTEYTAGRRGFRARGPNIARKMDLSQTKIPYNPPVSPNSPNYKPTYDGYHDPNEDPSYSFTFRTPTYTKQEVSDSRGRVNGAYYYYDDIGERHDVTYEAGSKIGFNVKTPFPDSKVFSGLFYKGPSGKAGGKPRGKTSILQRLDGSYRFVSSGPDQRRTEISDSARNVRGSYTYVDDKGQQRTVEYIAGPNIGYRIVKKGIGPNFPAPPPFIPPPNFTDLPDRIVPTPSPTGPFGSGGGSRPDSGEDNGIGSQFPDNEDFPGGGRPGGGQSGGGGRPGIGPSGDDGSIENSGEIGSKGDHGFQNPGGSGGGNVFGGGIGPGSSGESNESGGGSYQQSSKYPEGNTGSEESVYPPNSGESSVWPPTSPGKTPSSTKPPPFNNLFEPSFTGPEKPPSRPTTSTTIVTSSTTEVPQTGYPNGKPNPGSPPFQYPNNCCGSPPSTGRPIFPSSAFPEDDPNRPHHRPPHGQTDGFLTQPFEDLPPKGFDTNYFKPTPTPASRPSYYYNHQPGDSTYLSSNKNYFSFPSGVAVRAHIQSLDILPFGSRIPPPGIALEQGISHSG